MSEDDKKEFEMYCRNASDSQLDGIIEKESAAQASRACYVEIAENEKKARGL